MGTPEWIQLVLALVTGIGIPLIVLMQRNQVSAVERQIADRREQFQGIHKRLDHLDSCIDDVRGVVYSKGVTREELLSFKSDVTETLNRMRGAISSETGRLDARILRLEDPRMQRDGDR